MERYHISSKNKWNLEFQSNQRELDSIAELYLLQWISTKMTLLAATRHYESQIYPYLKQNYETIEMKIPTTCCICFASKFSCAKAATMTQNAFILILETNAGGDRKN